MARVASLYPVSQVVVKPFARVLYLFIPNGTMQHSWGKGHRERDRYTPRKTVRDVITRPFIHHDNATHPPTHQSTPRTQSPHYV